MFWTNWVRGISKLGMFISIVASIVCGGLLIATEDDVFMMLGIIVIVLGILITISLGALIMMISEISINTYNTQSLLEKQPSGKMLNGYLQSENQELTEEMQQAEENIKNTWLCKCGKRNPNSAEFCANCKRRKESLI